MIFKYEHPFYCSFEADSLIFIALQTPSIIYYLIFDYYIMFIDFLFNVYDIFT